MKQLQSRLTHPGKHEVFLTDNGLPFGRIEAAQRPRHQSEAAGLLLVSNSLISIPDWKESGNLMAKHSKRSFVVEAQSELVSRRN